MNIALVHAPFTYTTIKMGSSSIHHAHTISILKHECGASDVEYISFNSEEFFALSKLIMALVKKEELFPVNLLPIERRHLLTRLMLEEFFNISGLQNTNSIFQIEPSVIKKAEKAMVLVLQNIVSQIFLKSRDAIFIYACLDISFTLILCKLIRERDKKIPILILDNYTFEPATPYFTAPLTGKNLFDKDISPMISADPVIPVLRHFIPELIDYIIVGESYDVIRVLFGSSLNNYPVIGKVYTTDGSVSSVEASELRFSNQNNRVVILYSSNIDLDSLPLPEYAPLQKVFNSAEFELGRGCTYNCVFCERTNMMGNKFRKHSLDYLKKLIPHMLSYNFDFYNSLDCSINLDEELTVSFLEMLEKEIISFPFQANLRGKAPNRKLIKLLSRRGCEEVAVGIESGDDLLLKSMNKVQDISVIQDLAECINDNKMNLMLFLIIAFPTESISSIKRTIDLILKLNSYVNIDIIEVEFYHPGHIQILNPVNFNNYGVYWTQIGDPEAIKKSSSLFFQPGIYGMATYKHGMKRSEIRDAAESYIKIFNANAIDWVLSF